LANTKQAKKRAKQNEVHRQRNASNRSRVRTFIKNVRKAILGGDKTVAQAAFTQAEPEIDCMVNKGILHRNAAARYKSRLTAQIKTLGAKAA